MSDLFDVVESKSYRKTTFAILLLSALILLDITSNVLLMGVWTIPALIVVNILLLGTLIRNSTNLLSRAFCVVWILLQVLILPFKLLSALSTIEIISPHSPLSLVIREERHLLGTDVHYFSAIGPFMSKIPAYTQIDDAHQPFHGGYFSITWKSDEKVDIRYSFTPADDQNKNEWTMISLDMKKRQEY